MGKWVVRKKDTLAANRREIKENEQRGRDVHEIMSGPVSINSAVFTMIG